MAADGHPIRRAIVSVSDKAGVVDLAKALAAQRVEILSTGGTARELKAAGVPVRDVAEHTGFPEMMDGRLKTLHPKVHGGILGRRDLPEHLAQYQRLMDKLVEKDRDARFRNADEVIGFLSRKFYQGTGAFGAETTVKL